MTIYPEYNKFKELGEKYNLVPVWTEIPGDMETPVSAFLKIKKGPYSFLLESAEQEEKTGRYSFLSSWPEFIVTGKNQSVEIVNSATGEKTSGLTGDPLKELEKLVSKYKQPIIPGLPEFLGGSVGCVSYDYVKRLETLPNENKDDLNTPEIYFMGVYDLIVFDHFKRKLLIVSNAFLPKFKSAKKAYLHSAERIEEICETLKQSLFLMEPHRKKNREEFRSNVSKKEFVNMVRKAKKYIHSGDVIQVVLSQRWKKKLDIEPISLYRALRSVNPSPYMFYLELSKLKLVGSSPEILVKLQGRRATVRPIAGTRKRGINETDEKNLEQDLLRDEKERAEHIMLVDLGRNDLGRACKSGSIKVTELMGIEKYSHVMHIVSNVEGDLLPRKNGFDLLRATFPAGTVSGAPKIRAMEIIEELESLTRGPYAGAIGYFSFNKNMDFCITIRTAWIKDDKLYLQAGAGIVADSVPESEFKECFHKAKGMIKAYESALKIE